MNPSRQVAEICNIMALGCRPHPAVSDDDWQPWLNGFEGIPVPKICSKCGKQMTERTGKYGQFWGCSGYPKCRHTENIVGGG